MAEYANIIVDIFNEKLDKTFQYRIPEAMKEKLTLGMQVYVPFGKRNIKGYVVELTDEPEFEVAKIKEIIGIVTDSVPIESQLIEEKLWGDHEPCVKNRHSDQEKKQCSGTQKRPPEADGDRSQK